MTATIKKASDWNFEQTREINTLEELLALTVEFKTDDLIVSKRNQGIQVRIYDDYVE